jgi:hypothetical protein
MKYAYPEQLASSVLKRWHGVGGAAKHGRKRADEPEAPPDALPDADELEELLCVCYQASLMREEERPITFRAILTGPRSFPPGQGPPSGLLRLRLDAPRPFDAHELRRLSPGAEFHRSLIAVEKAGEDGANLRIWGSVHSGTRWIRRTQGGREVAPPLPPVPVVHVTGPGRLSVYRGDAYVAGLEEGRLREASTDVFASGWMPRSFAPFRAELDELHRQAREQAMTEQGSVWAPLDADLSRHVGQHAFRRIISVIRDSRHGGTILFVPPELTEEFSGENGFVGLKYRFAGEEPRRRYRTLILAVMNRLAETHGKGGEPYYSASVGWEEYRRTADPGIAALDEAIFEVAHLIAALASVDGAVVMSKRLEIVGYGGEISGALEPVGRIRRALDLEGERYVEESTENVGTRHRSAYRLAAALPGVVAVVVSQDGGIRFVTKKSGALTYWDHA